MVRTRFAAAFQSGSFSPKNAWNTVPEVYSRITGYYRPVQNWNDGKLQEYANRTEYQIGNSVIKGEHLKAKPASEIKAAALSASMISQREEEKNIKFLFTTKTCPNCKLAKEYLKDVDYTIVDAEENMDLAVQYGVMQAPTLVIVTGQSQKKYVNVSNIKKYATNVAQIAQ